LLETEKQRRWWFATHPEFSSKGTGHRSRAQKSDHNKSEKISPEAVDAYVDEQLEHERDPVIIQLLKSTKFWFGTEFASKSPEERHALLWEDEEDTRDEKTEEEVSVDLVFQLPRPRKAVDKIPMDVADAYRQWTDTRDEGKGVESDPHTYLDLFPYRRLATAPIQTFRNLLRNMARGTVVSAAKRAASEGPGKWKEVARSPLGLQHQSKMSNQPIRDHNGKLWIREYDLNGVKFDDYKNGKLYEYKGPMGNLINRKTGEFYPSCNVAKGHKIEAEAQVRAAKGIPVIWRVGENQIEAFKKALGNMTRISIVP